MPELPEVETVRRQLHAALQRQTIQAVDLYLTGREVPAGPLFVAGVVGKTVESIDRRAKLLIWRFKGGSGFIGHLKMTGKFLLVPLDYTPAKHDRLKFITKSSAVIWNDVRKFGYVKAFANTTELESLLTSYGPEPLISSAEQLAACLLTPKTRLLKAALLDQTVIAGIGNIYADESLFAARIRPDTPSGRLKRSQVEALREAVVQVLEASIGAGGTTFSDFRDLTGTEPGEAQVLVLRFIHAPSPSVRSRRRPIHELTG